MKHLKNILHIYASIASTLVLAIMLLGTANTSILDVVSASLGSNSAIRQILHVGDDDGLTTTATAVYDIDGTQSALSLATTSVQFTDEITGPTADHFEIKSVADNKNVRINSRDYTLTSGGASAVQVKPNMSVGGTSEITGIESSPRFASGISGNSLTAIKADPVLKGGSTDLSGSVKGVEVNVDFGTDHTGTISGDVSAYSFFYDSGSGLTRTGNAVMFLLRAPNIGQLSHLLEVESGNSTIANSAETGTSGTKRGWILIEVNGTDRYIRTYDAGS